MTEDQNIATLRACLAKFENYFEEWGAEHETEDCPEDNTCACPLVADINWAFSSGREALSALASTLAERDRRIAALEGRQFPKAPTCPGWPPCGDWNCERCAEMYERRKRETQAAPPAPAPGELAGPIDVVRLHAAEADLQDSPELAEQLRAVCDAAESWQRLQWRPASEAPRGVRVLFVGKHRTMPQFVCIGARHETLSFWLDEETENGGDHIEWREDEVLGWLPLDALPALNGGDDNG